MKSEASVIVRPVTPQDEPGGRRFFARLSPRTRRLRFHDWASAVNEDLAHAYTHIDHDRHAAFVCEHGGDIARLLMNALIEAARALGFCSIEGLVLSDNSDMLDFVKTFGFEVEIMPRQPAIVRVVKRL